MSKSTQQLSGQSDVNTVVRCDNCGSQDIRVVYEVLVEKGAYGRKRDYTISDATPQKPVRIDQCSSCGLMFVPPSAVSFEILKDYEDYVDENYIQEEKGRRRTAVILLERIAAHAKKGRMLDIGCATSFFLDEAKKMGWEVSGVEPSRWARKYAQEKFGIKIIFPTLNEADFEPESFDVIVMLDVFEHLAKPREMLLAVRRILKKDGLLVVTTPDVNSLISRILQAKWWGINRHHLFYFSKRTLEDMFDRTGFCILDLKSHARVFTWGYWLHRITAYSSLLRLISKCLIWIPRLRKQNVKISFYDQIELYARKTER